MRRHFGFVSLCLLALVVILSAILIAGCGKGSEGDTSAVPPDGMGAPIPGGPPLPGGAPMSGGPTPPGAMPMPGGPPGAPGATAGPGQSPMPGAPTSAPAPGQSAASPGGAVGAPKKAIPFSSVNLKSGVTKVNVTSGGTTLQYLRFKYLDWDNKVCLCELPASEAAQPKTPEEWTATFDIYKQAMPTKGTGGTKKNEDNLNDFPFVSPRPTNIPYSQNQPR